MSRFATLSLIIVFATLLFQCDKAHSEINVEKAGDKAIVTVDGQPFTEYLTTVGAKPILWPIFGPTGLPMTRAYPMEKIEGEKADHRHQRSFWFTHGEVNGVSYWHEDEGHGSIVHREWVKLASGDQGVIVTRNDWMNPQGERQLTDERTLVFRADSNSRTIDFDITLLAVDGDVHFGDTKEGSFGIRTAKSLRVDAGLGGRIINSNGQTDKQAWGKPAPWVDYHGPLGGETEGIAILNHPSSFRFPTYWHVRTYGLFAANVFGLHDFKGSKDYDGSFKLPKGDSISFRYRVIFHKGDEMQSHIKQAFEAYAREKK